MWRESGGMEILCGGKVEVLRYYVEGRWKCGGKVEVLRKDMEEKVERWRYYLEGKCRDGGKLWRESGGVEERCGGKIEESLAIDLSCGGKKMCLRKIYIKMKKITQVWEKLLI